jgi:hypothetical protein
VGGWEQQCFAQPVVFFDSSNNREWIFIGSSCFSFYDCVTTISKAFYSFIKNQKDNTLKNSTNLPSSVLAQTPVVVTMNNWNEIFLSSWCKSSQLLIKTLVAFRLKVTGGYKTLAHWESNLSFQTNISWKTYVQVFPKFIIASIVLWRHEIKHMRGFFAQRLNNLIGIYICNKNSFQTLEKYKARVCPQHLSPAGVIKQSSTARQSKEQAPSKGALLSPLFAHTGSPGSSPSL